MGVEKRAPSPTWLDESTDTIALDPELAKIARQVKLDIHRQQSLGPGDNRSTSPAPEELGGPESVVLKIAWVYHPSEDPGKPLIWAFRVKRVGLLIHCAYNVLSHHFATA